MASIALAIAVEVTFITLHSRLWVVIFICVYAVLHIVLAASTSIICVFSSSRWAMEAAEPSRAD